MEVDGEEALVATEEALPERGEGERAAGHEEEGDLGDALEGELLSGGHEGGAPEELVVGHGVREVGRVDEGLEPGSAVACGAAAVAGAVGGGGEEELGVGVVVVAGDVGADGEADDDPGHEDDHGGDELEDARGPVLARRVGEVVALLVAAAGAAPGPAAGLEHRLGVPPHGERQPEEERENRIGRRRMDGSAGGEIGKIAALDGGTHEKPRSGTARWNRTDPGEKGRVGARGKARDAFISASEGEETRQGGGGRSLVVS